MSFASSIESPSASIGGPAASAPADIPGWWPQRANSRSHETAMRRWHLQTSGAGPTLLLLHGTGASSHSWRDLIPLLGKQYHVVAPDLPGHGFTGRRPGERLSLEKMTASIAELIDDLKLRPAAIIGHSAGAAIGLRLALDRPDEVPLVIGINAALLRFGGAWHPLISPLTRLCSSVALIPKLIASAAKDPAAVRRMLESTGSNVDALGLDCYQALMRSESHVAAVLSMMGNWRLDGITADLPALRSRLVLLTGDLDQAVPPEQASIVAGKVRGASVHSLGAFGHLAHEEAPVVVATQILSTANRLD